MPFVALAGIGSIGEALVALGFLVGLFLIAYLISKFGSQIPLIGGWLSSQSVAFIAWAVNSLSSVYNGALWALTNLVNITVVLFTYPMAQIRGVVLATAGALWWLKYSAIPNAINVAINWAAVGIQSAYNYTLTLYYQAVSVAQNAYNLAIGYANAVLTAAYAYTYNQVSVAFSYALNLYYGAISYVDNRYQAAIGLAYAIYNNLSAEMDLLRNSILATLGLAVQGIEVDLANLDARLTALIEQYAAAAEKDALYLVDVASSAALVRVWPDLVTDVDGILAQIPDTLIDIRDDLASIPRAIPTGLLDALVGLGAIAVPLLRYLKECGVPMCRDLHGLSDLLGDLASAETDAALFGLIALAIRDPRGAAHDIADTVGPIARDAESLFKQLIGM